jgi:glycosyltransferase involved in cell wall biosynthesis
MGDARFSISVVIPTLNAGRAFGTLLHRITDKGPAVLEILCVDAGSQDGTRHIVSQFPVARFVEGAEPSGPKTWNRAMSETRGDVVAFIAQDALPPNGDWLSHLVAPFDDSSVGGVYGRQDATVGSDVLSAFRLAERFCKEAHTRRPRVGDPIRYKSLPFFLDNAAVRRSTWRGIHFKERLPVGADRVWARQVVLASYTIAYAPEAVVAREVQTSLRAAYHLAFLTGYTDRHFGDEGGTLWPDSRRFAKRAAWYLLKQFALARLPYLVFEEATVRYGYERGLRLDRMDLEWRERPAPETDAVDDDLQIQQPAA